MQHRLESRTGSGQKSNEKKPSATSITLSSDSHVSTTSEARLQTMLLSPLAELSAIPYPDVRQKQLDTVLHILHASGETLNHGWPLILTMIGSLGRWI